MALLVCDAIHQDPATRKHTLLGLFAAIGAQRFPVQQPSLAIFAALTEVYGAIQVEVRICGASGEPVLWRTELPIRCEDPRAVVEIAVRADRVTFPVPGEYRVQLLSDGGMLMERRLGVHPVPGAGSA